VVTAAKLIAEHLRRQTVAPALVLCSSALRTRETLKRIAPALDEEVPVQIEDELYTAPPAAAPGRPSAPPARRARYPGSRARRAP
jgi:phosphohistidine phosphatase